nr:SubclassB1_beta_lactamase [uncultured bacterium]
MYIYSAMKNILLILAILMGTAAAAQDTLTRTRINQDLEIIALSSNAYLYTSWFTSPTFGRVGDNGLIYVNNNEAVFLDAPTNDTISNLLLDWFAKTFPGATIKAVVVNHFHDDALGGLKAFHQKGITSYANFMTNESIHNDSTEKPKQTFTKQLVFRVGKSIIINAYLGEAHTKDNIVTYIPAEKILFGGCMVKSLDAGRGFLGDANLKQWSATVTKVKNAFPEAKIVIPGHGDPGGIPLLDYTIKMFEGEAK